MRTVQINKGDLVNALTENRKKHKADYELAAKGYREYMATELGKVIGRLNNGENLELRFDFDKPPTDYSRDYDIALKMLEMSVECTIELTHDEFCSMVLDDWSWKRSWQASNSKYFAS